MAISKSSAARVALAFVQSRGGVLVVASPSLKVHLRQKNPIVRGKPIVQAKPSTPMGCKLVGRSGARGFGRSTVLVHQNLRVLRPLKTSHRHRPPLPLKSNNGGELLSINMAPVRGHFLDFFLSRPNDGDAS